MTTKKELISLLGLQPHIEGGYFRRTYESDVQINIPGRQERKLFTSIFYMLTDDSPIGYFHRNVSDIMHYYHTGAPLTYLVIDPSGCLYTYYLGHDICNGEVMQLLVNGNCWKATILEKGEYGLISEAVAPGFDYRDMEIANTVDMQRQFPALWPQIVPYIK